MDEVWGIVQRSARTTAGRALRKPPLVSCRASNSYLRKPRAGMARIAVV